MKSKPMTMKKRFTIVMLTGFLLNEALHQIANMFHLPVWLDTAGTVLVAIILGPTAALIVGLANNMILALFYYNARSLFYYASSASIALIVGLLLKKEDKIVKKRIIPVMIMCMIIPSILSGLITLWENSGHSSSNWEWYYTQIATATGVPIQLACMFGALMLKIPDIIIESVIVFIVYKFMPSSIKYPSVQEVFETRKAKEELIVEIEARKRYKDDIKKKEKSIENSIKKAEEDDEQKIVDEYKEEVASENEEGEDD